MRHVWRGKKETRAAFFCDWPTCSLAMERVPFKFACLLKRHMVKHSAHKPFMCPDCGDEFKTNENLKRHSFVHTGLKPHICNVCNRAYARSSERSFCQKRHTLVAKLQHQSTTEKPALPSPLVSLLDIETGIDAARPRPYKCTFCREHRGYTDPASLRRHMRMHHPSEQIFERPQPVLQSKNSTNESLYTLSLPEPTPACETRVSPIRMTESTEEPCEIHQPWSIVPSYPDNSMQPSCPIDLCNSAMCLETFNYKSNSLPDAPHPTASTVVSHSLDPFVTANEDSFLNQCGAVDLSDTQHYLDNLSNADDLAINLSAFSSTQPNSVNPIDLSAPPPHDFSSNCSQFAMEPINDRLLLPSIFPSHWWDSEPGFSFAELLTSTDDLDDGVSSYLEPTYFASDDEPLNFSPVKQPPVSGTTHPPLDLRLSFPP